MTEPLHIQCDVDGVLANFVAGCLGVMRTMGYNFEPKHVVEWDIAALLPPEARDTFWERVYQPGFCLNLPLYENAFRAYEVLVNAGHSVHFLTSAGFKGNPHWEPERIAWLAQHFGRGNPVGFSSEKHLCPGDLLIEDKLETANAWGETGRPAVLVHRPYNEGVCGPNVHRLPDVFSAAVFAVKQDNWRKLPNG